MHVAHRHNDVFIIIALDKNRFEGDVHHKFSGVLVVHTKRLIDIDIIDIIFVSMRHGNEIEHSEHGHNESAKHFDSPFSSFDEEILDNFFRLVKSFYDFIFVI